MTALSDDIVILEARWVNATLNLTAQNGFALSLDTVLIFDTIGEDVVQAFRGQVESAYVDCVSNQWYIESYAVKASQSQLTIYEEVLSPVVSGTLSGDALAPQLSTLLSLRTTKPGKRGRGRVFLPPANEASNSSEGRVSGAFITGAIAAFKAAMFSLATHIEIVYANYTWGVISQADQDFNEVSSVAARNAWATQRGRTR